MWRLIYMVFFIAGEHVSLFFCSKCYQLKINKQKKGRNGKKEKSNFVGWLYLLHSQYN